MNESSIHGSSSHVMSGRQRILRHVVINSRAKRSALPTICTNTRNIRVMWYAITTLSRFKRRYDNWHALHTRWPSMLRKHRNNSVAIFDWRMWHLRRQEERQEEPRGKYTETLAAVVIKRDFRDITDIDKIKINF